MAKFEPWPPGPFARAARKSARSFRSEMRKFIANNDTGAGIPQYGTAGGPPRPPSQAPPPRSQANTGRPRPRFFLVLPDRVLWTPPRTEFSDPAQLPPSL